MSDLISREAAIDALKRLQKDISGDYTELGPMAMAGCGYIGDCIGEIQDLPSAEQERCMDETKVQIGDEVLLDIGTNPDWYISTIWHDKESFNVELRRKTDYNNKLAAKTKTQKEELPSAEPGIVRYKECKHFHYDMPYVMQGIPILGHEVCDFWGDGCKTNENGFCSYAEQKEREVE